MSKRNVTEIRVILNPLLPEKHRTVVSLADDLNSVEKSLKFLENIDSNGKDVIVTKQGIKEQI